MATPIKIADHYSTWGTTYNGSKCRREAGGRLMNLRLAQALFDDEWLTEVSFNPEANTDRVIQALDSYREHGVLALNVSLQGGNPGYGKAVPEIKRDRAARLGRGKGSLISAFLPDGSLKPAWTGRLLRLQRALDERGMILVLMYFYVGQDRVLRDSDAIQRAVINATDWLVRHNCRNVIIEIANEYDLEDWEYDPWIPNHIGELIELARSRFTPDFRLPIGASTKGMPVSSSTGDHADLTMIHGNTRPPEEKRKRVIELFADSKVPGPIFMDEDDNGKDTTTANFTKEIASLDAVWQSAEAGAVCRGGRFRCSRSDSTFRRAVRTLTMISRWSSATGHISGRCSNTSARWYSNKRFDIARRSASAPTGSHVGQIGCL